MLALTKLELIQRYLSLVPSEAVLELDGLQVAWVDNEKFVSVAQPSLEMHPNRDLISLNRITLGGTRLSDWVADNVDASKVLAVFPEMQKVA